MINNNSPKRRVYVFYILGILLSATVLTVDIFSEKSVSTYLNNKLSILSPTPLINSISVFLKSKYLKVRVI